MNTEFDKQAFVFNQRASDFDKLPWVNNFDFYGNIFNSIAELSKEYIRKHKTIKRFLDVGTGTGVVLKYLTSVLPNEQNILINTQAFGIDISNKMLEIAKKRIGNNSNVHLTNCSIVDHNFEYGSFDFIICRNSFHHFDNPQKAFQEMQKLVKRGGRIFIIEGVAPDNYTLNKWKEILLLKDVGRNNNILLSFENIEDYFKNNFNCIPDKIERLIPIPMTLKQWLDNAPITINTRKQIYKLVKNLLCDKQFSEIFSLRKNKDKISFLKQNALIEFICR